MELIIFAIGLLTALLIGRFFVDNASTLYYLHKFNSEDKFMDAYSILDTSEVYEYFRLSELNVADSYSDYLKLHQESKDNAWKIFSSYLKPIRSVVILMVVLIAVLPILFFQEASLLFYFGFTAVIGWFFIDRRLVKERERPFYLLVLLRAILTDEEDEKHH